MKSMLTCTVTFVFTLIVVSGVSFAGSPEIGKAAPDFSVKDSNGKAHSLSSYKGKYVVLEWISFDCPFVNKHYKQGDMQKLQKTWTGKDVVWLSICSSAPGNSGHMRPKAINKKLADVGAAPTAYLVDDSGKVGHKYEAKTTPHMFVVNPEGNLVYKGAIDSIRSTNPEDVAEADNYVADCLAASLAGKAPAVTETKSYGCGIKYRKR